MANSLKTFDQLKELFEEAFLYWDLCTYKVDNELFYCLQDEIEDEDNLENFKEVTGPNYIMYSFDSFLKYLKSLHHINNFTIFEETYNSRDEIATTVHFIEENVYITFSGYYDDKEGSTWEDIEILQVFPHLAITTKFFDVKQDPIDIATKLASVESILEKVKTA